jgi:hypothetical protein
MFFFFSSIRKCSFSSFHEKYFSSFNTRKYISPSLYVKPGSFFPSSICSYLAVKMLLISSYFQQPVQNYRMCK